MGSRFIATCVLAACSIIGNAQPNDAAQKEYELQKDISFINQKQAKDDREVVGVAEFKCQQNSPYTNLVTEKVVEVLKNSNRFFVVDRTNMDKINAEMEHQKREEFIGKDVAEQGNSIAAQKMIIGTITKIMVYRMKNPDGSVRGYKAGVAFEMQMQDVATRDITQATSFEGKQTKECVSAQAAVQMCMDAMENDIAEYFRTTFPLKAKVMRIAAMKNGIAESIMIKAGAKHGVKVGTRFKVESIEMLDGEELPTEIGTVVVTKLIGETFSECKVERKFGQEILDKFNAGSKMYCTLIIEKK